MQKIVPFLWFDSQAEEAAKYYGGIFPDSRIIKLSHYSEAGQEIHGQPPGSVMTVDFEIFGQHFVALNGGTTFKFSPATSFQVRARTMEEADAFWTALAADGKVLMEYGQYPSSERFGWTEDKYGLSWQVIYQAASQAKDRIVPMLMFVGKHYGQAEAAVKYYTDLFRDPAAKETGASRVGEILRFGPGEEPEEKGMVKQATYWLAGQQFAAMDSAYEHEFAITPAVSFLVNCDTQDEVDYFWTALSAEPEAEQCGWLKDKYGVSWQIVPSIIDQWFNDPDRTRSDRVMEAFMPMKKIDIATLKRAYDGS